MFTIFFMSSQPCYLPFLSFFSLTLFLFYGILYHPAFSSLHESSSCYIWIIIWINFEVHSTSPSSNFDTQYLQRNNWIFRFGPTFTASCTVALFEQPTASQILLLRPPWLIPWLIGELISYGLLDSLGCRVSNLRSGES
jgi:hypothetical protein